MSGFLSASPATLDHAGIAARVPHAAAMCLLERLLRWDAEEIECSITGHADAAHPLRERGEAGGAVQDHGLPATCAIEYAAQAMALHASLQASRRDSPPTSLPELPAESRQGPLDAAAGSPRAARGPDVAPTPGFLASAREVRLHTPRLDTAIGPLRVLARRQAGDERQAMYRFALHDAAGALLVEGRATVVLNSPLPLPLSPATTTTTASPSAAPPPPTTVAQPAAGTGESRGAAPPTRTDRGDRA